MRMSEFVTPLISNAPTDRVMRYARFSKELINKNYTGRVCIFSRKIVVNENNTLREMAASHECK